MYDPEQELCIDKLMMPWHGRLIFRQYNKSKQHKYVEKTKYGPLTLLRISLLMELTAQRHLEQGGKVYSTKSVKLSSKLEK